MCTEKANHTHKDTDPAEWPMPTIRSPAINPDVSKVLMGAFHWSMSLETSAYMRQETLWYNNLPSPSGSSSNTGSLSRAAWPCCGESIDHASITVNVGSGEACKPSNTCSTVGSHVSLSRLRFSSPECQKRIMKCTHGCRYSGRRQATVAAAVPSAVLGQDLGLCCPSRPEEASSGRKSK